MAEKFNIVKKFIGRLGKAVIPLTTDILLNKEYSNIQKKDLLLMNFLGDCLFTYVPLFLTFFSNDPAVQLAYYSLGKAGTSVALNNMINSELQRSQAIKKHYDEFDQKLRGRVSS